MRRRTPRPQAIDDVTGFKVDHAALKRQWDGFFTVDPDKRNPQDLIRARPERSTLENARPETPDSFIAVGILTEDGIPILTETGLPILTEGQLNGVGL